ncbi:MULTISPECIES: N-acetylmuramoyl-L-alanine amidase [unclassified Oceanobacillus]|uniref:N-acetylmuramoyl-L-alanine amidase n=1 Tax=unclassified Oceanobacillus TaxID=2630292 RepID=UPI00300DCCFE
MIKKLITYAVIFFMIFHFSIPGVNASVKNNEVKIPGVEEQTTDESEELEEKDLEIEESSDNSEGDSGTEAESESNEESFEEESIEEEMTESSSDDVNNEADSTKEKDSAVENKASEDSSRENEKESEEENQTNESSVFSSGPLELPYKLGDNHKDVIPVKVKLNALGFDGIAETGNYGSHTAKRVKEFQTYYGLNATGEVDQKTLDTLNAIYNSPYQVGNSNSRTTEVKKILNALGYGGLAEGPVFGSLTEVRVKQFQNDYGLKAHGIVDEPTYTQLKAAYNKTEFKQGDDHPGVIPIKQKLNALGFDGIAETGKYGSHTAKRVSEFQAYYGLAVTGVADQKTREKLDEVYNSPYQKGNSNSRTAEVKEMLNALGYSGLAAGPVFGSLTEKHVKQFQSDYGLKAHGIVDEPTYSQLKAAYNKTEFKQGDDHPGVIPIKQKLNALGFDGIAETGNYGSHTAKRVSEFQAYYGLTVTGIADQKTQEKLDEVYNSPYQRGKSNQYTAEIKKILNTLGYGGLADGPVFGALTEKRLIQFQRDNDLKAHGIADDKTISKLEAKVIKKGNVSPIVTDLKSKLNSLGYNGLAEGPVFGNLTEKRLKEFQRDYGLRDYGFADNQTLDKLDSILANALKKGDRKPEVIDLKRQLNSLGYDGLALTSHFGSLTETRVKQFQQDNNLPVSGIADERTLKEIKNNSSIITIYIDPGHGGNDPGSSGYGLKEKDAVLDIGKKIAEELAGYSGVRVILSRAADETVSLYERTNAANSLGVNFFLSLHMNAHNGSANGFESYIYNGPVSRETIDRQNDIHDHIASWLNTNNGINDRGAKRANYHVLRESTMPALLLEYMFIDNQKENNLLRSKSYRDKLGIVTAQAIAKSFNLMKK